MFLKKRWFFVFVSLLVFAIFATYCWASEVQVRDILQREVQIPKKINRILAVGCSLREVLSFKVTDKIVGIEYREKAETDEKGAPQGSDLPYMLAFPELFDLPVVNIGVGGSGFNHELIIQLSPDIIFMGASETQKVEDLQSKTGIPVITVYTNPIGTPKQDEMFYQSLRVIGTVLSNKERAEELINIIENYKKDLTERTINIPEDQKLMAYIAGRAFYGSHGMTATDPQWPPFNWINIPNVASVLSDMSTGVNIDKEALVGWNPDVIFISPVSLSIIENELQTSPFKELKAVVENKVYYILPYCWYSYNKENAIVDAYYIGKKIFPEVFADIDINQKGVEVFKKFYGDSGEDAYYKITERFKVFQN